MRKISWSNCRHRLFCPLEQKGNHKHTLQDSTHAKAQEQPTFPWSSPSEHSRNRIHCSWARNRSRTSSFHLKHCDYLDLDLSTYFFAAQILKLHSKVRIFTRFFKFQLRFTWKWPSVIYFEFLWFFSPISHGETHFSTKFFTENFRRTVNEVDATTWGGFGVWFLQ